MPSTEALTEIIRDQEERWYKDNSEVSQSEVYYAKTLPIIQSSDTGKYRLVDEMGIDIVTICFIFGLEGQTAHPPGDTGINAV